MTTTTLPIARSLRDTVAALSNLSGLNAATWKPIAHVKMAMKRKLVVNSVVNPLTALLGCHNGDLLKSAEAQKIIEHLCVEAALAFAMRAPLDEVVYTTQLFTFCLATEKHQMVVQLATPCLLGDDGGERR